jgi:hypothetical protein
LLKSESSKEREDKEDDEDEEDEEPDESIFPDNSVAAGSGPGAGGVRAGRSVYFCEGYVQRLWQYYRIQIDIFKWDLDVC